MKTETKLIGLLLVIAALFVIVIGVAVMSYLVLYGQQKNIQQLTENRATSGSTPEPARRASLAQPIFTPTPTPIPTPEPATLHIQAAIIYNLGGAQALASQTFYLLDTNLEVILRRTGVQGSSSANPVGMWGMMQEFAPTSFEGEPPAAQVMAEIARHTRYRAKTDLQGRASFTNIKPGTYYVYGTAGTRGGFAIWNVTVNVPTGENSLVLDNTNAAIAL